MSADMELFLVSPASPRWRSAAAFPRRAFPFGNGIVVFFQQMSAAGQLDLFSQRADAEEPAFSEHVEPANYCLRYA